MLRTLHRNRAVRAGLALLLILGLVVALFIDRARLAEKDRAMTRYIVGTTWALSEFLFEAQRYDTALADILAGRITVAELQLRHDILWSRLDIIHARARTGDTALVPIMNATRDMMAANDALLFSEPDLTFVDLARIRAEVQTQLLQVRAYWVENVVADQNRLNFLADSVGSDIAWDTYLGRDMTIIAAIAVLLLFAVTEFIQSTRETARERRLHAAARAASAAKSRFLANVSHEVRTPLNGILGMAQVLRDTSLTPDQAELVDTVTSSGESLLCILNEVLDLSKVEAGRMELDPHPLDLGGFLQQLALAHGAVARAKGISFETWFAPGTDQTLLLDALRVRQMLNNLLSNAIKFTAEGVVTFEASLRGDGPEKTLTFTISDTGIGMSPEQAEHVFEPFTQADSSTTRDFGGTGLGLTLVRELSALAGGNVAVDSAAGKGSCFTLTLPTRTVPQGAAAAEQPRAQSNPQTPASGASVPPQASSGPSAPAWPTGPSAAPSAGSTAVAASRLLGLRVLIVDDSRINRRVLRRFLAPLEADVVEACNGSEGLDHARTGGFDVALVDVQMPLMDGPQMIRRLREAEARSGLPRLPVVAVTANVQTDQIASYHEAGMDRVLPKPLRRDVLFAVLDGLVTERDAA